jgi:hypothetical protein
VQTPEPQPESGAADLGVDSSLPSVGARVLAFAAILVGGLCGGMIGYSVTDLQCTGNCSTNTALGAVVGAVLGALGVAVIAVLALRAMGEWKTIQAREADRQRGPNESRRKPSA